MNWLTGAEAEQAFFLKKTYSCWKVMPLSTLATPQIFTFYIAALISKARRPHGISLCSATMTNLHKTLNSQSHEHITLYFGKGKFSPAGMKFSQVSGAGAVVARGTFCSVSLFFTPTTYFLKRCVFLVEKKIAFNVH